MASGVAITSLGDVEGEFEELPGVSSGLVVRAGEIVNVRLQNGGGYGDPLLRDPDAVLHDLRTGAVTPETAQRVYGVVARDGAVDVAATESRRDAIRVHRRRLMVSPDPASTRPAAARVPIEGQWGESLRFADGHVHCAHCRHDLGPARGDWRELVASLDVSSEQLGPLVPVHKDLAARMFVCPECVAALWADVLPVEGAAWTDFRLH
jgi:N-methylhydantoinase B